MKIKSITLENIRVFKSETISLSPHLNIFIGENSSGKSTILKTVLMLQYDRLLSPKDRRYGAATEARVELTLEGIQEYYGRQIPSKGLSGGTVKIDLNNSQRHISLTNGNNTSVGRIQNIEPHNYIYPHLANRKVAAFNEGVKLSTTNEVTGNFAQLYPKIDRVSTPAIQPAHTEFVEACKAVLGIELSSIASENGKKGGYIIKNLDHIALDSMGDGVANIAALLCDLCVNADGGKLYLIEEIENDMHPRALKELLRIIESKSSSNQFIITTHSNIVLKQLGAIEGARSFQLRSSYEDKVPTTEIVPLETSADRWAALEAMGYELYDLDLWKGWIFFEESSAEALVTKILIPFFVPGLRGFVRTFSAKSISQVKPKFDDFNKLFVYLHLQGQYHNKVWVVVDGGVDEEKVIQDMRSTYASSGWLAENFVNLQCHDIEEYYPPVFSEEVKDTLAIKDKQLKRTAKKELLLKVLDWAESNPSDARIAFESSAAEIIDLLINIEGHL